jgi:2-methylaconitate cis-trans-isomerase PrpF
MIANAEQSREESPATPILGIVSPPASYRDENAGTTVNENEVDLVSRLMFRPTRPMPAPAPCAPASPAASRALSCTR